MSIGHCRRLLSRGRCITDKSRWHISTQHRALHYDGRNRLSNLWTPTQSQSQKKGASHTQEDGHELLIRAGFLRQAHSGVFHLLPLGLRVLDKAERLIDKHMRRVSASKVDLSSLSSRELWEKSGRLDGRNKELFQLEDRKEAKYLLAPTHEEEITTIVKNAVHSYRDLPLRLYQISRKYRDEARPRQGLLRGREFVMKDLYTFDIGTEQAMKTYHAVSEAYHGIFEAFNIPYLVANADAGNMGGNHSHEYHFPSDQGEDTIIECRDCHMRVNEELFLGECLPDEKLPTTESDGPAGGEASRVDAPAQGTSLVFAMGTCRVPHEVLFFRLTQQSEAVKQPRNEEEQQQFHGKHGVTYDEYTQLHHRKDRDANSGVLQVYLPKGSHEINVHALEKLHPDVDAAGELLSPQEAEGITSVASHSRHILYDPRIPGDAIENGDRPLTSRTEAPFKLTKAKDDDRCPNCGNPSLVLRKAIEVGHTFHLGTRYSKPLEARVHDANNALVDIEMGCHGIGVSRLIGAMATMLADSKGLNWPLVIAPYGIVIIKTGHATEAEVNDLYDQCTDELSWNPDIHNIDFIIDDRDRPVGWKLKDADLIGYPFIVVLGKAWKERGEVEVQCRRKGSKEMVSRVDLAKVLTEHGWVI